MSQKPDENHAGMSLDKTDLPDTSEFWPPKNRTTVHCGPKESESHVTKSNEMLDWVCSSIFYLLEGFSFRERLTSFARNMIENRKS